MATYRVPVSEKMADSSCVVEMSSTGALVLLLRFMHRSVENEILFGANHCNSSEN